MKPYKCGPCGYLCQAIADLHEHLVNHDEIIGYFFHIGDRTAFPKGQQFDRHTQTGEETISEILQNVEQFEIKTEIDESIETESHNENDKLLFEYQFEALSQTNVNQEIGQELNKQDEFEEEKDPDLTCKLIQDTKLRIVSKKKQMKKRNWFRRKNRYRHKITTNNETEEQFLGDPQPINKRYSESTSKDKKETKKAVKKSYNVNKNELGIDEYMCMICSYINTSETEIQLHVKGHTKEGLMCNSCGKTYRSRTALCKHRKQSKTSCRGHDCNICKAQFSEISELQEHIHIHSVLCDQCGQSFTRRGNLAEHKKFVHDLVRNYKCNQCGKSFQTLSCLKAHVRNSTHQNIKPYCCESCGKSFFTMSSLNVHKRTIHDLVRNYKCDLCGKSFQIAATLRRHVRTHQNITPHCCEFCGKGFSTRWNMKAHMRQHNGDKPYSCSKCGEKFAHNVSRKNHEAKCSYIPKENT